jgi:phytanoyl-CoA hydroxylase
MATDEGIGPDNDDDDDYTITLSETEPLSLLDMERLKSSTRHVLTRLREVSEKQRFDDPTAVPSWIRPVTPVVSTTMVEDDITLPTDSNTRSCGACQENDDHTRFLHSRCGDGHFFDMYGFLIVPAFCTATEVNDLKVQMRDLVERDWHPGGNDNGNDNDSDNGNDQPVSEEGVEADENENEVIAFGTDETSNSNRGDYFLDSANRVSYFAEPQALMEQPINGTKCSSSSSNGRDPNEDENKELTSKTILRPEYSNDKVAALNKAGHGMHCIVGSKFREYCHSAKLKDLVMRTLGWQDPVVPQSMYIFKQSQIGGTVHSHQDSTFLYTTPRQSCLGVWLALDDATLQNGCLWVRPGSHNEPVRRQFLRNPQYFDTNNPAMASTIGNPPQKLIFKKHHDDPNVTWDGALPKSVRVEPAMDDITQTFIPVEVKAGDAVVFCGTLDHFSLPNLSNQARHTFQLHLVEGPHVGIQWSPENWLQYPLGCEFVKLNEQDFK